MATASVDDSIGDTSDILFEMFCESCRKDNKYSKANGFCKNCEEYYCEICQRFHDRFLRNHTYQDEISMPQDFCFETCEIHSTEIIKFYCENCSTFACSACKTLHHKDCSMLRHVPSIVKDIEQNVEFISFKNNLEKYESQLEQITETLLRNKQEEIARYFENAKSVLEAQNEDIRKTLDCFKEKIESKLEKIKSNDEQLVDDLLKDYKNLCSKCTSLRRNVETMRSTDRQRSKLFITMKKSLNDIMTVFEKSISAVETRCKVKKYVYEPNNLFQSAFELCHDIGSVADEEDKMVSSCKPSTEEFDRYRIDSFSNSLQRSGIIETTTALIKELDVWKKEIVNIAVMGCSGVGKSTFINSLCEFEPEDSRSARTGVFGTTSALTPYYLRRNRNVVLWDFPGFDIGQMYSEKYFSLTDCRKMDFVIILLSARVTEKDLQLINSVEQLGKMYYLLRSKFDNDLENTRMVNSSNSKKEYSLKMKLKTSCKNALKDFNWKHDIFIIDSFILKSHDYEEFEKVLIKDAAQFSEGKCISLTFALPNITEFAKTEKRLLLQKRLAKKALQAATLLTSSKDIAVSLKDEENLYKRQFFSLSDAEITSNKDLSYITNALTDLKETLIHKSAKMAKHSLFKEQNKMTDSLFPFFYMVETYEVCWVWLNRSLERTVTSSYHN